MKIPSTKSPVSTPTPAAENTSNTSSSSNVFSQMIAEMAPESQTTESEEPVASVAANTEQTPEEETASSEATAEPISDLNQIVEQAQTLQQEMNVQMAVTAEPEVSDVSVADSVVNQEGREITAVLQNPTNENTVAKLTTDARKNPMATKQALTEFTAAVLPMMDETVDIKDIQDLNNDINLTQLPNVLTKENIHPNANTTEPQTLDTTMLSSENKLFTNQLAQMANTNGPTTTTPIVVLNQFNQPVANLNEQQSKNVDMLVQLGNLVNAQTTRLVDTDLSMANAVPTQVKYEEIANKVNFPEYELKIDITGNMTNALNKEIYNANIKIYPPELGPVLAQLKVDKNSAELVIMTQNNQVKEIVQANLPQLRESFQKADINLTNVQIDVQTSSKEQNSNQFQAQETEENTKRSDNTQSNATSNASVTTTQRLDALVDTYA